MLSSSERIHFVWKAACRGERCTMWWFTMTDNKINSIWLLINIFSCNLCTKWRLTFLPNPYFCHATECRGKCKNLRRKIAFFCRRKLWALVKSHSHYLEFHWFRHYSHRGHRWLCSTHLLCHTSTYDILSTVASKFTKCCEISQHLSLV